MDEDFFSDDTTLDALPDDELQALEDAAVRGTQFAQSQVQPQQPQQKHKQQLQYRQYQYYCSGRTPPSPQLPSQLPVGPPQQQQRARYQQRQIEYQQPTQSGCQALPTLPYTNRQQNQPVPLPLLVDNLPSSDDYGGFDEATELWDSVAPKAQGEEQTYMDGGGGDAEQVFGEYGEIQQHISGDVVYNDKVITGGGGEEMVGVERDPGYYTNQQLLQHQGLQQEVVHMKELKETIEKLQSERETLQQNLHDALNAVTSKAGEIAVVRSSIARSEREHQRVVASLTNLQREVHEKYKREIEAITAESERMKTETVFLRKEVEEGAKQNRSLVSKSKRQQQVLPTVAGEDGMDLNIPFASGISAKSPATTPKRNHRSFALRDGFEDEEMVSPSRAGNKTPKGVKRKRSILDSPIQALPSRRMTLVNDKPVQVVDEALLEKLWKDDDDKFDFFKAVMAHKTGGERTLESLMKFSFPSSPRTTLSTFFQDRVTLLQSTAVKSEFSAGVCGVLLSVWSGCLQEKLYGALHLVLGLLQFSIVWDQGSTCHHFFEEAVDLIQLTIDINAIPVLKGDFGKLEHDVDVDACLRLLEGITLGLAGNENNSKRLWKRIRVDFPLVMLNANQPLRHIKSMISILSTSCLGDSFGPLSSNESEQRLNEGHLLDIATRLMTDTPKPMPNEPKYTRVQVVELQREVLQFLGGVAGMEMGVLSLARNQSVLPRLVKRIAEELEEVYEFKSERDQSIQFLNSAARLLHGILKTYPSECAPKLAGSNTSYKHLVAMTRLAFSVGSVQEIGIEEDVIDSAYGLLDSMVTPNEAESLWALFHPQ